MTDHVHMLVQIKPSRSVSEVVQILKGGTSRKIREEYPELEEFLWGDSLWADGYFAETVGIAQEDMIKRYIQEQREQNYAPEDTKPWLLSRGECSLGIGARYSIGAANWNDSAAAEKYKGSVADVRIYNRVLSAAEVRQLYLGYELGQL